jgi:hypothetical protein
VYWIHVINRVPRKSVDLSYLSSWSYIPLRVLILLVSVELKTVPRYGFHAKHFLLDYSFLMQLFRLTSLYFFFFLHKWLFAFLVNFFYWDVKLLIQCLKSLPVQHKWNFTIKEDGDDRTKNEIRMFTFLETALLKIYSYFVLNNRTSGQKLRNWKFLRRIKVIVFWDAIPRNSVHGYQRFGGICCFHLHSLSLSSIYLKGLKKNMISVNREILSQFRFKTRTSGIRNRNDDNYVTIPSDRSQF